MVVLAPWSSLTLPSGRAKPLVRGEGNPAALPPPQGSVPGVRSPGVQWPAGLLLRGLPVLMIVIPLF